MNLQDFRDDWERQNIVRGIRATDRCMSGWGGAEGGTSVAIWACASEDEKRVLKWVRSRGEMKNVRAIFASQFAAQRGAAHVHVYVVRPGHPALGGEQSANNAFNVYHARQP
jgi:hypothetical protein